MLTLAILGGPSRQTWIELCQKASADPHDLVDRNLDKLFNAVIAASMLKVGDLFQGVVIHKLISV